MNTENQLVVLPLGEVIAIIEGILTKFRNEQNEPYHSLGKVTPTTYTRNEVAAILKVTPNTVSRYRKKQLIHGSCLNGKWRFSEKELNRFINLKTK